MPLAINNELKVVFSKEFYAKKHVLWGILEDGRVVDASDIASKTSAMLGETVHVRTEDTEKRVFTFYTKTSTLGTIYFGSPEEHYVKATAIRHELYCSILEKIFKTVSAEGEHPLTIEIVEELENPKQISINILPKLYLKTHENIWKNISEKAGEITSTPRSLLEDLIRKHTEYGVIAVFIKNKEKRIMQPTCKPPKHNIPLLPSSCPIGFIVGYTPNLAEWLVIYYDPIGYYGIGYYKINGEGKKFINLWKLKFSEKEKLGDYRLVEIRGKVSVRNWMDILSKNISLGSKLEEVIVKNNFSVENSNVFSAFFMVPVRKVSKSVEEYEVYVYSKYWTSPKLIRTKVKLASEHYLTGLNWVKKVNLTPSMKWSKILKQWRVLGRISLITACVLSILKG